MFLSKRAAVSQVPTLRAVLNYFERYPPAHVLLGANANIQSLELKVVAFTQSKSNGVLNNTHTHAAKPNYQHGQDGIPIACQRGVSKDAHKNAVFRSA